MYPKQGQPIEQQHFDENECFAWAKYNKGIDPNAPVPTQAAANDAQQQAAAEAQRQETFADGFSACMDGRGYSDK